MKVNADGRAHARVARTQVAISKGEIDITQWDDEELIRGRPRDKRGNFTGKAPILVSPMLHRELTRRRFSRAFDLLAASLVDASQMLRAVVNDKNADVAHRIRAAEVIFDRVVGKPKESVSLDITGASRPEQPWQQLIMSAIVANEGQARALPPDPIIDVPDEIVEGEVVEASG
jgi:hypothetical protein